MKFKGRNGGMAIAIRNHIMLFRVFVISLLISIIPIMFFICAHNPYFWIFLIIPLMSFVLSFAVLLFIKHDENVFLSLEKKDHVFEIKDNHLSKDGKEIKHVKSIKIYRYKNFLYMETSHSIFIVKDTDFIIGDRERLLKWATVSGIKVKIGY